MKSSVRLSGNYKIEIIQGFYRANENAKNIKFNKVAKWRQLFSSVFYIITTLCMKKIIIDV